MQKFVLKIVLLALVFLQACSHRNGDINNIHDPYLAKAFFNSEWKTKSLGNEEFYYTATVVDSASNINALGVAEGHWLHPDVLRWEITKDKLIGWRPNATALGAGHEDINGVGANYRGAPVVAFKIETHFDIEREFDDSTMELSNTISENTDKPWNERHFIRVDWSKNIVGQLQRNDGGEGVGSLSLHSSSSHVIDNSDVSNPNRPHFSDNYFDVTTRHPLPLSEHVKNGKNGVVYANDSAAAVVDIRHSFLKMAKSNYQATPAPDYVALFQKREELIPINKRFGFFRTHFSGRNVYNHSRGNVSDQAIYNATLFNIWEKSIDDVGKVIPMKDRVPKPVIYYTNALHPNGLLMHSKNVAKEWNNALKEAVFYGQEGKYKSLAHVPNMFILRENSCNFDEVKNLLNAKYSDLKMAVENTSQIKFSSLYQKYKQHLNDDALSFTDFHNQEVFLKKQLTKVCSALEFYSQNFKTPFIFQRSGDLRFNLMNLEVENDMTAWSGYGPMISDPVTGETIKASANVNLKYIDARAAKLAEQIGLLTSNKPGLEAVYGQGIYSDELSHDSEKFSERLETIRREVRNAIHSHDELATRILDRSNKVFDANKHLTFSKKEKNFLEKARELNAHKHSQKTHRGHKDLRAEIMDPLEFIDDISIGIAYQYAHLPYKERFKKIRGMIYESVMLHEVGHNMGLLHNMAGSADALNYGEYFWWVEKLPKDPDSAIELVNDDKLKAKLIECRNFNRENARKENGFQLGKDLTTKECLQQKNGMYSSIMDYHASTLAGVNGLGSYDKAAIKFFYGKVLEVFPLENISINLSRKTLDKWLSMNSYRQIPVGLLKDEKAIFQRKHEKYNWDQGVALKRAPKNAVPYKFCSDSSGRQGEKCLAFDFGPDMTSMANWLREKYKNQYLLNSFAKDYSWQPGAVHIRSLSADMDILDRFTLMMQWYHRRIQDDPDFDYTFAEEDYLRAMATGLNHFVEVLGTPEVGAHVSAPNWTLEEGMSFSTDVDRLSASDILVPISQIETCDLLSITKKDDQGNVEGQKGFTFKELPLGVGRPSHSGYEDGYLIFSGTDIIKKYALSLLAKPLAVSLGSDQIEQSKVLSINWYQVFPEAVGKIFDSIITKNTQNLGPTLEQDGKVTPIKMIDEKTLKLIEPNENARVSPAIDESMRLFALANVMAYLPDSITAESSLEKSVRISCQSCPNDVNFVDLGEEGEVVSFAHLSGHKYQAAKIHGQPSSGAELLEQANNQKDRYLALKACVENEEVRRDDPFCHCVKTKERRSFDSWVCCGEDNEDCPLPELQETGNAECSLTTLKSRMERSKDNLNAMVGFIDELRHVVKSAEKL